MKNISSLSRILGGLVVAWATLWPAASFAEAAQGMSASAEAETLVRQVKSGALLAMNDEQLLKMFTQLDPQAIPVYLELGLMSLNEYEMWMTRQENLAGVWTKQPFKNYVKYRQTPRQVYMKWLKDSPKSGQEIIYDETKRKDASYGHLGGLLSLAAMWSSIDGSLAKGNSNHTVRDIGLQSVVAIVVDSIHRRVKEGQPIAPNQIEITKVNGERTVALKWVTPPGMTGAYAAKSKVYLDLSHPWVRMIESWDERGDISERISFDKVVPATFTDADFDPKNASYGF